MTLLSLLANVLFVGQSLLTPTLPDSVEAALRRLGGPVHVEAQISRRGTLADGLDKASARLEERAVDVLIVTEAQPIAQSVAEADSAGAVAQLGALALQGDARAQIFVMETWPRIEDPGAWRAQINLDLPQWEAVVRQASGALDHPVTLIPAGQAMGHLADAIAAGQVPGLGDIRDVFEDADTPNAKGVYFLTMLQVAAITGASPVGLPAKLTRSWPSRDAVISDDLAIMLQAIAWDSLQSYVPGAAPVEAVAVAAPAPPEAALPDFAPITNPNLAVNLAPVNDWSVAQPFLDVMKTARPWIGHLPGQWGGWGPEDLARAGALGPGGCPQRIPAEITGISTLILTDLPAEAGGLAGRYLLTYQGNGTLAVSGRAEVVEASPGRILFDFTPGEGAVVLTLSAIDADDPIRDIVVVRADRAAALAAGAMFNPDWLARLRGVKGVRFADWMATNGSTLIRITDRPMPGDYTYASAGVPVEVMLALANELHTDPWFTLPHQGDDDLVRTYAQIVQAGLDTGLTASVEYSNEVWNPNLPQGQWAAAQAKARWGQDGAAMQYYGLRAAQVAAIWADVFKAAPGRLRRVVATQTGWPGLEAQILDAPLVVADGGQPPGLSFDAYAVSGGFSGLLGAADQRATLQDWLKQSTRAAQDQIAAAGLTGDAAAAYLAAHRYDLADQRAAAQVRSAASDSLTTLLSQTLPYHASVAADRGLKLVMYEGGSHVVDFGSPADAKIAAYFTHFNYTPEMAALYADLLAGWQSLTDQPFTATAEIANPGAWGSWGALRHLGDDNPRWQVLAKGCVKC